MKACSVRNMTESNCDIVNEISRIRIIEVALKTIDWTSISMRIKIEMATIVARCEE